MLKTRQITTLSFPELDFIWIIPQVLRRKAMKLIVPMCGKSSRYPGKPPKWMLPSYDGMPMIYWALSGLKFDKRDLIFTVLSEHDSQFGVINGLKEIFGNDSCIIALDQPTRSQAET